MFSPPKKLVFLVLSMGILAAVAALGGICSSEGDGPSGNRPGCDDPLFRSALPALGLLGGTVYLVFLSLMMITLTAKVAAMGILGYNVVPVVYIIPSMTLGSLGITWRLLRSFSKLQEIPEVSEG